MQVQVQRATKPDAKVNEDEDVNVLCVPHVKKKNIVPSPVCAGFAHNHSNT